MRIPFFGSSYTLDSVNADAQSCINLYPEIIESKEGKNVGRLRGTPGLSVFATLPASNVLGLWAGAGRLFAVAGTAPAHLYEVFADGTHDDRGSVGNATLLSVFGSGEYAPALIFPNGNQIMVIHGGFAWVDNGSGVAAVNMVSATYTDLVVESTFGATAWLSSASIGFGAADVGQTLEITGGTSGSWNAGGFYTITSVDGSGRALTTPQGGTSGAAGTSGSTGGEATETFGQVMAGTGAYLDTYGIVAPPASRQFYISAINNFLSWSSLDEGNKEGYPDNILCLFADHELLWIFGDLESTETWQDTGNANFPFQRLSAGGLIHYGLAAQFSPVRLGFNGMAWLAWSAGRGQVQAVYCQGLIPQRVSTHAIEQAWKSYPTVEDAIAYSYIEDGHEFWVIHFPSGDATWVYDLTASLQMGSPVWHQRGYWDGSTLHRQLQRSHAYGFLVAHSSAPVQASHFVGDYSSGKIYLQSVFNYSDNGHAILRQRACPHISQDNLRAFYSLFQLELETGNQDIPVVFDYSRDFGHNFINPITLTAVAAINANAPNVSGYRTRLRWRRLGNAWDMIPRISITSSTARISITNAFMEAAQGN